MMQKCFESVALQMEKIFHHHSNHQTLYFVDRCLDQMDLETKPHSVLFGQ